MPGPKRSDITSAELRDYRTQVSEKMTRLEDIGEAMVREQERILTSLIAKIPLEVANMPFLQLLEDAPGALGGEVGRHAAAHVGNEEVGISVTDATMDQTGMTNMEETFALPSVKPPKKKHARPPTTIKRDKLGNVSYMGALKTPAVHTHDPYSMVASTPATALRGARMGEMLMSAKGSPVIVGEGDVAQGAATIIRTKDGLVTTMTDSPPDPYTDANLELGPEDLRKIKNLKGKLSLILRQAADK